MASRANDWRRAFSSAFPRAGASDPRSRRAPLKPAVSIFWLRFSNFEFLVSNLGSLMISLAGKAALITGGSRGIGAAAVKLFAQAGADVVFNYVKAKDGALQIQQEAGKHGKNQNLACHTTAR